ncbi:hypothetical protein POM88_036064 [Heracleum sosnowskyi]|uniref:Amino acid transporter transmembrane domain-containing protein n=1 Tax=Heracleum sosnowskyi TaxID=360622 RepID=A0AAD8HPH2_9APIA|nr:hypothetical protein POM88_036064 [Heracleum sosnowskyi]
MLGNKQVEEAIVANETEHEANREESKEVEDTSALNLKSFLWHGGSAWDAWFSCASNQVSQVLLTLPYSFSQLGFLSGILFQIFYGLVGSWTAYLISVLYLEYRSRKEKKNVNFKNHVIQILDLAHNKSKIEKKVHSVIDNFAERGLRSLGVAGQEVPEGNKDSSGGPWEFIALLPLFDPVRHDSAETIRRALELGVSVKMITCMKKQPRSLSGLSLSCFSVYSSSMDMVLKFWLSFVVIFILYSIFCFLVLCGNYGG